MYKIIPKRFPQKNQISRLLLFKRMVTSVSTTPEEKVTDIPKEDPDLLQKIDVENLPRAQKRFVQEIQRANDDRIQEIFRRNYRNIAGFVILSSAVVAIYFYTMYAVKQETILEEIDYEMREEADKKSHDK